MSTNFVEGIHTRIRDELTRSGLSMAEAARQMQEESSQGLRDVCAGRKRASAELVGKLAVIPGIDVLYVLTGQRAPLPGMSQSMTYGSANVVAMPTNEYRQATSMEILGMVLDALHKLGKTLPANAIFAVTDSVMALQQAGAAVNKSTIDTQLRLVK